MVRLLYFVFFAFIFSCTLIEDSDITSQEELDNLIFSSIEIKQVTGGGTNTSVANLTKDSVVNISVVDGGVNRTINRTLWMDWPALGANSKLKLKSGVTTGFKSYTSFLDSGQPWTFFLFDNDTTLSDQYRFRYDVNGRLRRIITVESLDYLDTLWDDFIYDTGGRLTSIERTSNNPAKEGTFTGMIYNTSNSSEYLGKFIFQGMEFEIPCQGSGCGSYWGGNYHVESVATQFPLGVMNLTSFQRESLGIQDFNDIDQSFCGGSGCDAWIDTFYLHPMMMLKDNFDMGNDLLFIYMVDWWQPVTTQESTNNEKVTFTFKYDL